MRWLLGTFKIYAATQNTFKYQMLLEPTSAEAQPQPASQGGDGTIKCWREREQFDAIMRALPTNTTIHFTGLIETKGVSSFIAGAGKPKNGQRLLGSSMASATLKLVGASRRNGVYAAVGTEFYDFLSDFVAENFTIDCNVDGQISPYTVCGALFVSGGGRHVRIRRVRAIGFGSRAPDDYIENFVFVLNATHSAYLPQYGETYDGLFEDCIAELPSPNIYWNSTIFHLGGGGGVGENEGKSFYHRGCVLRNNFVNCQIVYGERAQVDAISFNSTTGIATITTKTPHYHIDPGNVSVQGILVGGSPDSAFNGVFAIEDILTETQLTYKPYAADQPTSTNLAAGSDAIVGAPVSPHFVQVLSVEPVTGHTGRFRVKTKRPHNRTVRNKVKIGNVYLYLPGVTAPIPPWDVNLHIPYNLNPFNGTFDVISVESKTELDYEIQRTPPSSDPSSYSRAGDMAIGEGHQALSADAGTAAVVEGNRILHCRVAGPFHDTWSTRDLLIRNNYFHDVAVGPVQIFGQQKLASNPLDPQYQECHLTREGVVVTCDTSPFVHDLVVGQGVFITDPQESDFTGTFVITSVPTPTAFTYEIKNPPTATAADRLFAGYAQVGTWTIENNIIELSLTRPESWDNPTAIFVGVGVPDSPFLQDPSIIFGKSSCAATSFGSWHRSPPLATPPSPCKRPKI